MAGDFAYEDAAQFTLSVTCSFKLIVEIEDRNKSDRLPEFIDSYRDKNDVDSGVWFEGPIQAKDLVNKAKIPLVREGCVVLRDELLDKTQDDGGNEIITSSNSESFVFVGNAFENFPVLELTDDGWELVRAPPVGCVDDQQVQVQPPGKVGRLCSWFGKQVKSCFLKR